MSRSDEQQAPPPGVGHLMALARRNLTGDAPKRNAASLDGLERALARRQQRRRAGLWASAAAATLVGVVLLFTGPLAHHDALGFEVLHGAVAASGLIEGTEQGTLLRFSDGTEFELTTRARTQVSARSPNGADVTLERGRVKVRVVHLPDARWSVRAGAYRVDVTGTSFDVEFEPERRWLAIDLFTGSVSVSGPLINGGLVVSAGQRLMVLPEDSLVLVQRDVGTPALTPAEPTPAAAPAVGATAAVDGTDRDAVRPGVTDTERATPTPSANRARLRAPARKPTKLEPAVPETWSQLVVAGRFEEVLLQAEGREFEQVYRGASFDDLQALADAARYARRTAVARAAFLALRERFPARLAAREAAFFLGRLEETAGASGRALDWYEEYLASSPNGGYASQALGRKLAIIDAQQGPQAALPIASEYLRRFPEGPYAAAAAKLLSPGVRQ